MYSQVINHIEFCRIQQENILTNSWVYLRVYTLISAELENCSIRVKSVRINILRKFKKSLLSI